MLLLMKNVMRHFPCHVLQLYDIYGLCFFCFFNSPSSFSSMEPRYDQGQSPQEDPTPGSSGPPTHLVDPATMLTEKQILSESWNMTRLYSALPEEGVRALQWAARRR